MIRSLRNSINHCGKFKTLIIALTSFFALLLILIYPQRSFGAALNGLDVWLRMVFPALLPFFIGSEILMATGIVDSISILLEPLMQPIFRCPGYSSFIWAMSITSGYPMGAKLVSSFRNQNKISKVEGERILAFSSTSGPLFMIGAVGVGMLGSAESGRLIALSHYTAAILLGLVFRFHGDFTKKSPLNKKRLRNSSSSIWFTEALKHLYRSKNKDSRSFGEIFSDSVRNSVNNLLIIGGFIVVFSVIINLLMCIGIIGGLTKILFFLTAPLSIPIDLLEGVAGGIFEITAGCKIISQATAPAGQKLVLISFLIGWSGFSIHGQTVGFLGKTDLSIPKYILVKFMHGILSSIITWAFIKCFYYNDLNVFNPASSLRFVNLSWGQRLASSVRLMGEAIIVLFVLIAIYKAIRSIRFLVKNRKLIKR